jgi:hypothetical protein
MLGNLTLLIQIPKKTHWTNPPSREDER